MLDIILNENQINFNMLEKEFFRLACELACSELKTLLEGLDKNLMNERNKSVYRHKGYKKTTIKTLMGEVTFSRAIYKIEENEECETKFVYLLDEALGLDTIGLVSTNLVQKIVENVTVSSYRDGAQNISEQTGQKISHGGAWNVVQTLGKKIAEQEEKADVKGEKEVKVLFEEADGVYINIQGKDRSKTDRKLEMKVAISYEGWRTVGKNRRELVNKLACVGFENAENFYKKKEKKIASEYNVDEIEMRILNGDGASWIKNGIDDTVEYQLDPFHKFSEIIAKAKDKRQQQTIIQLLKEKKIDETLTYIEALINSIEDEKEIEKLRDLYTYFNINKKGLIPYQERGLTIPTPPDGLEYYNLGTMESNICQIITHRMKRRKASWSKKGAENLGQILALKACKRLKETLESISKIIFPETKTNEIIEILSAAQAPKIDGKGKEGNIHKGRIPFTNTFVTNGRQSIKKMFDYIGFSQMVYR